jgi:predicted nucleic acid-binding protein
VRYWDASALVPLIHEEPESPRVRGWLGEDPVVITWALTRLEIASAIERLARQGRLEARGRRRALELLERLAASWHEITDLPAVRARALALVARHPLRAADAAQLGAALVAADPDPSSLTMACLDRRLAECAEREGLRTCGGPEPRD